MNKSIATALCVALLVAGAAEVAAQQKKRPAVHPMPEIKKDCTSCHGGAGPHTAGDLKKKPSALCLDCHPDRRAPAEHQVDMVPSLPVKGLPLTDGKLTCITCHDPHQNLHGRLLRMKPGDLCLVCHPL